MFILRRKNLCCQSFAKETVTAGGTPPRLMILFERKKVWAVTAWLKKLVHAGVGQVAHPQYTEKFELSKFARRNCYIQQLHTSKQSAVKIGAKKLLLQVPHPQISERKSAWAVKACEKKLVHKAHLQFFVTLLASLLSAKNTEMKLRLLH